MPASALLAAAVASAAVSSAGPRIDLESFLSFPSRVSLLSCVNTSASVVAWVETAAGEANVYGATAGGGAAFAVTRFRGDDGNVIKDLTFTHDCTAICFTRLASDGSNPTHNIAPPEPAVHVAPFSKGASSKEVAAGALAGIHGSGGDLKVYTVTEATVIEWVGGKHTAVFRTRHGSITDLTWSPDGTRLAFTNNRGDHAFVGVYTRGQDRLQWMSPSVDTDSSPAWSPDGGRLAWVRFRQHDGVDGRGTGTQWVEGPRGGRNGPPFSVMVSKVEAPCPPLPARCKQFPAAANEVFRDWVYGYPAGGTIGYGARPMRWSADGSEVLFGSELSGFVHVTAANASGDVPAGTNEMRDLTPLPCVHQDWILSGDLLYLSHNCDMADSLGVAVVNVKAGPTSRAPIVAGTSHMVAGMSNQGQGMAPLGGGSVAYFFSTATSPVSVSIHSNGSSSPVTADVPTGGLRPGYAPYNSSAFVTPELVTFPSEDGLFTIHAQFFRPPAMRDGASTPAIIFTHGGSQRQMYAAMHYAMDYASLYAVNQYLVYQGYAVLSVNYRMGIGYGRAFRDCEGPTGSPGCGGYGAAEYGDVHAGRVWLGQQAGVNGSRVGIHGLSYGGLNCLQALSRDGELFSAGACNAPVFNWVTTVSGRLSLQYQPSTGWGFRNIPVGPESNLAGPKWRTVVDRNIASLWDSSPAGHVANITKPVLVLQGDSDADVDFQESVGLVRALRISGAAHYETVILPDERHGFQLFENQVLAARRVVDFLKRFV
eukprot:TRINITY_DN9108_c0_g1_i1.p1 TRINITY_DN9108_c0_g1~~TRINITY_DN9108_c0_g1_i1.p1  ORF type:complete len:791 (+),score=173.00 TRINITY_DN9108_c0_g1_i1:79-2373(+)